MSEETSQQPTRPRADLSAFALEGLSWKAGDCEDSLAKVFEHVRNDALDAVRWYTTARRPKRIVAFSARLLAILLIGIAAILPLVDGATPGAINPLWISLAIAIGAGALAFDRYLGSSSGWVRCIKTELQLRDALESFELDWECERATWQGQPPSSEQITSMLQSAKAFAGQINVIIQEETNAWVDEFQSSLKQIDETLKTRAAEAKVHKEAVKPGAVNLIVTNGDQCDNGWRLSIDTGNEVLHGGKTIAIPQLPPGIRVFRVSGMIGGKQKQAEIAATVPAGGAAIAELTLS